MGDFRCREWTEEVGWGFDKSWVRRRTPIRRGSNDGERSLPTKNNLATIEYLIATAGNDRCVR
jgi:hypothetical protein